MYAVSCSLPLLLDAFTVDKMLTARRATDSYQFFRFKSMHPDFLKRLLKAITPILTEIFSRSFAMVNLFNEWISALSFKGDPSAQETISVICVTGRSIE